MEPAHFGGPLLLGLQTDLGPEQTEQDLHLLLAVEDRAVLHHRQLRQHHHLLEILFSQTFIPIELLNLVGDHQIEVNQLQDFCFSLNDVCRGDGTTREGSQLPGRIHADCGHLES
jgi:hypothetical protein